jgi:hypothetical protein
MTPRAASTTSNDQRVAGKLQADAGHEPDGGGVDTP